MHTYTYILRHVETYIYIYVHRYMYICIYIYVRIRIYIHMYICIIPFPLIIKGVPPNNENPPGVFFIIRGEFLANVLKT